MRLTDNIKHLMGNRGLQQKLVAIEIVLEISHYNKVENGQREATVEQLGKLGKLYGISITLYI
jgi:transcriptional regulator with XRE-family HTH domain